jgi:hypothetical protein
MKWRALSCCSSPLYHPCSLPTDCSISQIIKDDYRLPFYNIIILGEGVMGERGGIRKIQFVENCEIFFQALFIDKSFLLCYRFLKSRLDLGFLPKQRPK